MPATLCSKHGWERAPIRPVFFAPTDIQPGGLAEELQERLRASRNLIVICSPNSAKSEWVGKEIEFFHQLGRTKQIHFFIVDGEPHSGNPDTECLNSIVNTLDLPEILGANIHEKIYRWSWMNKERAYVQLISKLLGVEFDTIWQRHRRIFIQKIIVSVVGIIALFATLFSVWVAYQPIDVEVRLKEKSVYNPNLPPLQDAVVTITLDNETKIDTVRSLEEMVVFHNIPHYYVNSKVGIKVKCQNYYPVDTALVLTKEVVIDISRNHSVFGNIDFRLWDSNKEKPIGNAEIEIEGQKVFSDKEGRVSLFIPLANQQTKYIVKSSVPLVSDTIFVPCGSDDIIFTKDR